MLLWGYRFLAMYLLLFSVSMQAHAFSIPKDQESTVLTWHNFQAPPIMINDGADRGQGIIDGVREILQNDMDDYVHQDAHLPYKRFLLYAKQHMNICTPYLFKTPEREKYLIFSKPAVIFPGLELIMHKRVYEQFDHAAELSLKDLFSEHNLRLATNNVRAYSAIIDPIVQENERKGLVSRHTGSTTLVFRLLSTNRADFMIDFPNRILYWAKELGVDPYDYVSIPIKEDYVNATSYVACPKTPWGQNVINRVNDVLAKNIPTPAYLKTLKRWSHDYHDNEIDKLYDELVALYKKGPQN